jgi:hypothetical protein
LQDSVKRYKETPVKLHTGEKPQSKVCTEIEKPQSSSQKVHRGKQVKRCKSNAYATQVIQAPPSTKLDNSAAYCYIIRGRKDRVQKEHLSEAG